MKCLYVLIFTLMTICKPRLEKSSKNSNKAYQLFVRISFNSYFGKYLKIWCQWFQGRHLSWVSTSENLDAVSQRLFQKELHDFFWEFGEFFQNRHKEQLSVNSSENIRKLKKLSRYYRGRVEGQELQWNCKRKQS